MQRGISEVRSKEMKSMMAIIERATPFAAKTAGEIRKREENRSRAQGGSL
jgi:hypothetical protein